MVSLGVFGLLGLLFLWWLWSPPRPAEPMPFPFFESDRSHLLLMADSGHAEAMTIMPLAQSALQSRLAQTGLNQRVDTHIYPLAAGQTAQSVLNQSGAETAVHISTVSQADQTFVRLEVLTAVEDPGLEVVIADLANPFIAGFNGTADKQVALRLALILNAAIGFEALHQGEYDVCSRRFHAFFDLLADDDGSFSRLDVTHITLGVCLDALGQAEAAREQYEAALIVNQNLAQAHYGLGNYWYAQRAFGPARQYYEAAIRLAVSDPLASDNLVGRANAALGNIALAADNPLAAVSAYDKAIAHDDNQPAFYLARALAFISLQALPDAESNLEQCLDLINRLEGEASAYWRQIEVDCQDWLRKIQEMPTAVPILLVTETPTLTGLPPTLPPTSTPRPIAMPETATHVPPTWTVTVPPIVSSPTSGPPVNTAIPTLVATVTLVPPPPTAPPTATVTEVTVTVTLPPTIPATATLEPTSEPSVTLPPTIPPTQTPTVVVTP